jgi:hypothetical protein
MLAAVLARAGPPDRDPRPAAGVMLKCRWMDSPIGAGTISALHLKCTRCGSENQWRSAGHSAGSPTTGAETPARAMVGGERDIVITTVIGTDASQRDEPI